MHSFLIGQYGSFDYRKYERDFKEGFYGIEACLLEREEDIAHLVEEAETRGFRIGIHFPLRAGRSELRDALVLSPREEELQQAYALVEAEIRDAAERLRPDYVLFHYPKPVILDDRVDWSSWRFADPREFVYESEYAQPLWLERSESLFRRLSALSDAYSFTPVLEFDALNRYVYDADDLVRLLERYPQVRLCLDTCRLFYQACFDPRFDPIRILRTYARFAKLIHLSTLQFVGGRIEHYKHPVLPEQKRSEGWAPIADYLRIVREENPGVQVLFEHRSDRVGDRDLERCYAWAASCLGYDEQATGRDEL